MDFFIEDGKGARRVEAGRFPLSIGGAASDIELASDSTDPAAGPLAYLGLSSEELFVQPAGAPVSVNGANVSNSYWLQPGDVVRIGGAAIDVEARENALRLVVRRAQPLEDLGTAPPAIRPGPGSKPEFERPMVAVKPIAFEPQSLEKLRRESRGLRPGALLFLPVLALLALAGWYVFTARSVAIEIDPVPDDVEIRGGLFRLPVGERYLLRPGTYRLVASKEGYRRLETEIEVGGVVSSFRFSLAKLPGLLAIATTPSEGARVEIDGEEVGVTPLEPVELSAGEHEVRIRADRYRDFTARVQVEGEGTKVELDAELQPLWARVTFVSEPAGARVGVAGGSFGPTPVAVELPEGNHEYEVTLAGRKPETGRVRVVGGEAQTVRVGGLAPAEGVVKLLSVPGEANVTVDGVYRGRTPLEIPLAPGTAHEIELARAGYESRVVGVEVDAGATKTMTVELTARTGEIEIVADPPDAALYVNGEPRGSGRQVLRLPATPQRIELRKEGYESFAVDVTPKPDFPQTIEATLANLAAKRKAAALPKKLTGPQGHELVLVAPRRFQMGASRREPGRRANESLREIEITRPFYVATMEVTNRQFREFQKEHRSGAVASHSLETDHHPAVRVSWEDAARYCNWLSAAESLPPAYVASASTYVLTSPQATGYRLPTEAEWALAARYAGGEPTKYAWGDSLPVPPGAGNYADVSAEGLVPTTIPKYSDGYAATAPADSFGGNALGIFNLGGNVAEWVNDHYAISPGSGVGVERDPLGPDKGEFHVIRGASYLHGSVTQLRLSFRDYGKEPRPDVGFRIARWVEREESSP